MVNQSFPKAIYLDTNALRKAGTQFDASWFLESRTKSENYNIPFFTICVCRDELLYAIYERIARSQKQISDACSTLTNHTGLKMDCKCPEIQECNEEASKLAKERLGEAGISVIDHHIPDVRQLVLDAVNKNPPFESNDKGFRDTIIVESICEHADSNKNTGDIWIVTNDLVMQKTQPRFRARSLSVIFVCPNDLADLISSRALSLGNMKLEEMYSALTDFAQSRQTQISESIDDLEINISSIDLYGYESGRPTILNVRDISLDKVTQAYPPLEQLKNSSTPGRFDINITIEIKVEVEIERTVGGFGLSLLIGEKITTKPSVLRDEGPVLIPKDDTPFVPLQKIKEIDTVVIKKTLRAKVTRKDQNGPPVFKDLEILSIDSSGSRLLDI